MSLSSNSQLVIPSDILIDIFTLLLKEIIRHKVPLWMLPSTYHNKSAFGNYHVSHIEPVEFLAEEDKQAYLFLESESAKLCLISEFCYDADADAVIIFLFTSLKLSSRSLRKVHRTIELLSSLPDLSRRLIWIQMVSISDTFMMDEICWTFLLRSQGQFLKFCSVTLVEVHILNSEIFK
jgi:hypothetical protein